MNKFSTKCIVSGGVSKVGGRRLVEFLNFIKTRRELAKLLRALRLMGLKTNQRVPHNKGLNMK
jgi:hypothetical protein